MVTEPLASIAEAEIPRTSLKTIYDEIIIPDLEFAVGSKLEDKQSSDGRITKYTARTILAEIYLTCAGYPYQEVATNPEKDWCTGGGWAMTQYLVNSPGTKEFLKKAKTHLDVLYGKFKLGTYKDLRDPAMDNKGEDILEAQYESGYSTNDIISKMLPLSSHISMFGDENGSFIPSIGYYNSYSNADLRKQERQFFFTQDNISKKYDPTQPPTTKFNRPYLFKYYDESAIKATAYSGLNWTFYRYADVLLMLTEVNWSLKLAGEAIADNDIVKGINEVRARALLPAYLPAEVNLFTIMAERAYEFIFENKMVFDQRRTRTCLNSGVGSFTGITSFFGYRPDSFSFDFSAMNLLSPVSGLEIRRNTKLTQNFGFLPKGTGQ